MRDHFFFSKQTSQWFATKQDAEDKAKIMELKRGVLRDIDARGKVEEGTQKQGGVGFTVTFANAKHAAAGKYLVRAQKAERQLSKHEKEVQHLMHIISSQYDLSGLLSLQVHEVP